MTSANHARQATRRDPRHSEFWDAAVVAARTVIEDKTDLRGPAADDLAAAVTDQLLGDFLTIAEAESFVAFTLDGTGPVCTWCGKIPGPLLLPGHPQYGVFCACRRDSAPAVTEPGSPA
jgi:hypothetical protein